jgi:D-glycero-D-manno-heptose 1,7-bisphosphate phosphatase
MAESGRPAVFLDRDGTVITEADYLADPAGVELVPGADVAIRKLNRAGLPVVLVTNQSGIARGLYDEADYEAVNARLQEVLKAHGATVDRTYHCPHHPDFSGPCDCRKPGTGMHQRAASDLGLDLAASFFVGDKPADVVPARTLSGTGILVRTGYGREWEDRVPLDIRVVDDVLEAVAWILGARTGAGGAGGRTVDPPLPPE